MRPIKRAAVICLSGFLLVIPLSWGSSEEKKEPKQPQGIEAQTKPPTSTVAVPLYKPPRRGAPGGRIGGGTRGKEREMFVLSALAPDHPGLTVKEDPCVYWFVSNSTSYGVELTIVDPRSTAPVLETHMAPPIHAGVHRICLADFGVRLEVGAVYQWFVAVVPDTNRRSRDVLAGGTIERVPPAEGLTAKLIQASKAELPFLYADAGLWYDAFAAISEQIERAPQDPVLRQQRAGLLAQVGLPQIDEGRP